MGLRIRITVEKIAKSTPNFFTMHEHQSEENNFKIHCVSGTIELSGGPAARSSLYLDVFENKSADKLSFWYAETVIQAVLRFG